MSSSGLDWRPILASWLRGRPDQKAAWLSQLRDLFTASFSALFTWSTQNLRFKMPVLEVNVITQVGSSRWFAFGRSMAAGEMLE